MGVVCHDTDCEDYSLYLVRCYPYYYLSFSFSFNWMFCFESWFKNVIISISQSFVVSNSAISDLYFTVYLVLDSSKSNKQYM